MNTNGEIYLVEAISKMQQASELIHKAYEKGSLTLPEIHKVSNSFMSLHSSIAGLKGVAMQDTE